MRLNNVDISREGRVWEDVVEEYFLYGKMPSILYTSRASHLEKIIRNYKEKNQNCFQKNFKIQFFFLPKKNLKSRCHTKRRIGAATHAHPSFGMTMTQGIRDIFAYENLPHILYTSRASHLKRKSQIGCALAKLPNGQSL